MKKFTYQVGIDVAKSTLDFTVLHEGRKWGYHRIANNPKAVKGYLQQLRKQGTFFPETLFCMEHTGVYNAHVLQALHQNNCAIWLEAALKIKESLGFTRGKNDKIDSYRIARYAYLHQDETRLWIPKRAVVQQLARLTMLRKRLVKTKVALLQPLAETKQFLGNTAFRNEKALTAPIASSLKKQIQRVERQIEEVIKTDEHLNELFRLVTSVEAIGPVTAGHLLVVTNEFRSFIGRRALALRNLPAMRVQPPLSGRRCGIVLELVYGERAMSLLMRIRTLKSCYIWRLYQLSICRVN